MRQYKRILMILCLATPALARPLPELPVPKDLILTDDLQVLRGKGFFGGNVVVDLAAGTIRLRLDPTFPPCPEGMACAAVMPPTEVVQLEGAETRVNECGVVHTVAADDRRPVDGALTRVRVTDNRRNRCPTFAPLHPTEVLYERVWYDRMGGGERRVSVLLTGDGLEPVGGSDPAPEFAGQIEGARWQNGSLVLSLAHSGGCREHAFRLKSLGCERTELLNTTLRECTMEIIHAKGSDDMCEAFIHADYTVLVKRKPVRILDIRGHRVLVH